MTRRLSFLIVAAFAVLPVSPAAAQDINNSVIFEDLGFTDRLTVGARPAAMAGAYTAAADDVYALLHNPAGLARVRRIDFSIGFEYGESGVANVFYGNPTEVSSSAMSLDALAAAYPLPTYRGSLVIAGGVFRVMTSRFDLLNRGFNTSTDTFDDYLLQQSGSVYSYTLGFGLDVGPTVSVGAAGFILDGTLNALAQSSFAFEPPFETGDLVSQAIDDDVEADLNGYGATLGVQFHPHRLFHGGLVVTTPIPLEHKGTAVTDTTWYFYNDQGFMASEEAIVESEYTIPFYFEGGVSFTIPELTVSLDAAYTDWRQADVFGKKLKDENLRDVFRPVLDIRIGAEYTFRAAPLRLRAGYAYTPYAIEYLQADRITQNDIQQAEVETERQAFAAGVGVLIDRVLTIDASFERQIGKRSIPTLVDERTSNRLVLSTSYRF